MRIVTVAQMRAIEAEAERAYGLNGPALMASAGVSLAQIARDFLGGGVQGARVLMLIGPGNNGGDGLVMSSHLRTWGAEVVLYDWKTRSLRGGFQGQDPTVAEALAAALASADVVVDALLGIGASRPLAEDMQALLGQVQAGRQRRGDAPRIIAVDLPTGVNADTGAVSAGTIAADLTITLGAPKLGLLWYPAAKYVGELRTGAIGLPDAMPLDGIAELGTDAAIACRLPARPPDAHKGTFGRVLVIAGSPRFPGAALLAGTAAARAGAGLVTLAVSPDFIKPYARRAARSHLRAAA